MPCQHIHVPYDVLHAIELAPIREPSAQLHECVPLQISHRIFLHIEALQLDPEPLIIVLAHTRCVRSLHHLPGPRGRERPRPAFKDEPTTAHREVLSSITPAIVIHVMNLNSAADLECDLLFCRSRHWRAVGVFGIVNDYAFGGALQEVLIHGARAPFNGGVDFWFGHWVHNSLVNLGRRKS